MPTVFAMWLHHFTFPPAVYEVFSFSASLTTFVIAFFYYYNYSGGYAVLSHCDFNLHLINGIECFLMCLLVIYTFFFSLIITLPATGKQRICSFLNFRWEKWGWGEVWDFCYREFHRHENMKDKFRDQNNEFQVNTSHEQEIENTLLRAFPF